MQWLQTAASLIVYAACCYTGCPKGAWRQTFPVDIYYWHAVPSPRPQTCPQHLFKAPGHSSQGPRWPIIMSIRTKVQNKEHVIEALFRAKLSSLATRRSTPPRSGDILSLMWMNLKTCRQKSGSSGMAVGSDTSQVMALGINRRPCTHESLDAVPSLRIPTNKFYFPVQKKAAGSGRGK